MKNITKSPMENADVDQDRLARVFKHASEVFGDEGKALEWLQTRNMVLSGNKPASLLTTCEGEDTILAVLSSIKHGGVV